MKKQKKASTKAQKQSKIEVTSINVTIGNKRFGLTLDEAKRLQSALNNALGYLNYSYTNPYFNTSGYSNRTTFLNDGLNHISTTAANSVLKTDGEGNVTLVDISIPDATGYAGDPYVNA